MEHIFLFNVLHLNLIGIEQVFQHLPRENCFEGERTTRKYFKQKSYMYLCVYYYLLCYKEVQLKSVNLSSSKMSIWCHIIIPCVHYSTVSNFCIKHCSSNNLRNIVLFVILNQKILLKSNFEFVMSTRKQTARKHHVQKIEELRRLQKQDVRGQTNSSGMHRDFQYSINNNNNLFNHKKNIWV